MERCKLVQLTIFYFLRFTPKGIICILDGISKSLSLLEGMCDLTNNIVTFVFCDIQYIWTDCTDIQTDYWEKIHFFPSAIHKISIFPSTILSKSPNIFLMELIFRYLKIT